MPWLMSCYPRTRAFAAIVPFPSGPASTFSLGGNCTLGYSSRHRARNHWRCPMGDKSPKAKQRQKQQDTTQKNSDKAAALAKATPPVPAALKKGK